MGDLHKPHMVGLPTENDLRAWLANNPFFGSWDEWAPIAYDKLPVLPRAAMAHLYGLHDDSELPYQFCALCAVFRAGRPAAKVECPDPDCRNGGDMRTASHDEANSEFYGAPTQHDEDVATREAEIERLRDVIGHYHAWFGDDCPCNEEPCAIAEHR